MTMLMRLSALFLIGAVCCPALVLAQPEAVEAVQEADAALELEQEITDFLEEVGRIMREQDVAAMGECVNTVALLENVNVQELLPPMFENNPGALAPFIEEEIGAVFAGEDVAFFYSTFTIWQIVEAEGSYIVSTTNIDDEGFVMRMRWWLEPNDDVGFLIRDMEIVDAAMRVSTMLGYGFMTAVEDNPELSADLDRLFDAMELWDAFEFEAMETLLDEVDSEAMPDSMARLCKTMQGIASINLFDESDITISHFREATRGDGVIPPIAYLYLAEAYTATGQLKRALSAVDQFEELFGIDSGSLTERGYAYEAVGEMDKAWGYFFAGIDLDPQDGWLVYGLAAILNDDMVDQFNQCYAQLDDCEMWFQVMLQTAEEENDIDSLKRIIVAHRLVFPDDPMLDDAADILLEFQSE